jgi:hypothetical protein
LLVTSLFTVGKLGCEVPLVKEQGNRRVNAEVTELELR